MTLTTVVGSSGSGKTTFLNDVYHDHRCIYLRQYHMMRPYIPVSKIPNFDPSQLPFWDIYVKEGTADTIKVGGTMGGDFVAGLSGGQRKLLLFELIYQRTISQSECLIVLDEPFAGVTDNFVGFIVNRLKMLQKSHNVVLVTNDHVDVLTRMADNTITVSAVDRTVVKVNRHTGVDRRQAILALSLGCDYQYAATTNEEWTFFLDVEVYSNGTFKSIAITTLIYYFCFVGAFWNSSPENAPLILIASLSVAYYAANPYILSLTEWRNSIMEESQALMHASGLMNKLLKSVLVIVLVASISILQFGAVCVTVDGFCTGRFWLAMFMDSACNTVPLICLGLYSLLCNNYVNILGSMPFVVMIFFSTTFSPGAGVPVLKGLRYLFSRFYFWCMIPSVMDDMEGCPSESANLGLMVLTALLSMILFVLVKIAMLIRRRFEKRNLEILRKSLHDGRFRQLQVELYGEGVLRRFSHSASLRSSLLNELGAFDLSTHDFSSTLNLGDLKEVDGKVERTDLTDLEEGDEKASSENDDTEVGKHLDDSEKIYDEGSTR